jgi:hypothetical protein
MSWVEDARKLMQDFVAPELRAISARFDAAERLDAERDKVAGERQAATLEKLEGLRRKVKLRIDLALANRRLEGLERRQQVLSSPAETGTPARI